MIEVVIFDVQVLVKFFILFKVLGQYLIILEILGNGCKCRGLDELRIVEESWDIVYNVEVIFELVYDFNLRWFGYRL